MMAESNSVESDIRSKLTNIDNFQRDHQMNNLCILASRVFGYGAVNSETSVIDIFDKLKVENEMTEALAILVHMIKLAGFSAKSVQDLSKFVNTGEPLTKSFDFTYERLLVFIANSLRDRTDDAQLNLVKALTDDERGTSPDKITTVYDLLFHMTNAGTITRESLDKLTIFVDKLNAIGLKSLAEKLNSKISIAKSGGKDIDSDEDCMSPVQETTPLQDSDEVQESHTTQGLHVSNMHGGNLEETVEDEIHDKVSSQQSDLQLLQEAPVPQSILGGQHVGKGGNSSESLVSDGSKSDRGFGSNDQLLISDYQQLEPEAHGSAVDSKSIRCCRKISKKLVGCFCCLAVLSTLAVLTAIGCSLNYSVVLSNQNQLQSESVNVYGNSTYGAFSESNIDTRFFETVSFSVLSNAADTEGSYQFSVQVCQVDCTTDELKTTIQTLHNNEPLLMRREQLRYFVCFDQQCQPRNVATLLSVYMLNGSNISVNTNISDIDGFNRSAVSIYFFNNVHDCIVFEINQIGLARNAVKNFTFDNASSFSFTVPSTGFYCGVWDLQTPINVLIEVEIISHVVAYDIEYYRTQDVSLCSVEHSPSDGSNSVSFSISLERRRFQEHRALVCLLVSQSVPESSNVTISSTAFVAKTNNLGFLLSAFFAVLFFIVVTVICTCVVTICFVKICMLH